MRASHSVLPCRYLLTVNTCLHIYVCAVSLILWSADAEKLTLLAPERYAFTSPSSASHLEEDMSDPSQLLASFVGSLGYIRANDRSPHYIVGGGTKGYREGVGQQAQFDEITGFAQVSSDQVLIADHGNNCIRMVDRQKRNATTAAGQCGNSGLKDGRLLESKFDQPYNIIRYTSHSFLVTDHNNHAIREINLLSGNVSTLLLDENKMYFPIDMAVDTHGNRLFVTLRYSVIFIDLDSKQIQKLSDDRGDKISLVGPGEVIITQNPRDYNKRKRRSVIKQLDISDNTTTEQDLIVWPTPNEQPLSLFLNKSGNTIYISEQDVIRSVKIADGTERFTTMKTEIHPTQNPTQALFPLKPQPTVKPLLEAGEKPVTSVMGSAQTFQQTTSDVTDSESLSVMTHIYLVIPAALVPALIAALLIVLVRLRKRNLHKILLRNNPEIHGDESCETELQNLRNDANDHIYQWLDKSRDDAEYTALGEVSPLQGTSSSEADESVPPSHPVQPTDEASMFGSRRTVYGVDDNEGQVNDRVTCSGADYNHNDSTTIYEPINSNVAREVPRLETSIAFEQVI